MSFVKPKVDPLSCVCQAGMANIPITDKVRLSDSLCPNSGSKTSLSFKAMATAVTPPPLAMSHVQNESFSSFSLNEKRYIVFLIAAAGWFSTLSSFIYYPVISLVAKDLNTTVAKVNLTVTSYLAISGVAPAFVGDAADMLGRRPLYVITLSIYVLANMAIALQSSFVALLLLRMLQSAGISGESSLFRQEKNGL